MSTASAPAASSRNGNRTLIPWKKAWAEAGHPQNFVTKRPYTGINTWLLAPLDYAQNYFLSFKQ
ncbi:ArdC-like ssDNA-binding domain-containing protein [Mucilaginibacter boryungensis]|uniref:DUF1738 domain-containing protein n=1 Tax=Mucilaginibacter boryungensis TaxID=768480 RepID=A0ABR9XLG9_9SPHI|nr:ArdC family protein [Mucilaginibacter boryungensis]MBE9668222.1 DUF1738 domain-containing protein [Mucilaginibacter boryungensis]